jgi:REP element-mobilizing transposase RayT
MKAIFKKQSNCVYHCIYHLVLCTKYRRKIFNDGIFAYMRETLKEVYWGSDGIWSDSYFASTVGVNEVIRRYIEQQGKEDAGQHQLKLV